MKKTGVALWAALAAAPLAAAWAAESMLSPSDVRLLDRSSTALTDVNPALSQRLRAYAVRESNEREETAGERTPGQQQDDLSLIKDSADALRGPRPDLAKELDRFAAKEKRADEEATPARRRIERQQHEEGY